MEAFNCDWSHTLSWRRSIAIDQINRQSNSWTDESHQWSNWVGEVQSGGKKDRQRIWQRLSWWFSTKDWQRFEHIVRGESLLIHRHSNAFRTLHNHMGTTLVVTHGRENSKHPIWCTLTLRPERDWFQLTFFEATWVLSESRTVAAARSLRKLWSGRPTMSVMYV